MNLFIELFSLAMQLGPSIVLGIQSLHANASKESKLQLAQEALTLAVHTSANIPMSEKNAQLAQATAAVASGVIALAVTSTQQNGTYQAATAQSLNLPITTTISQVTGKAS